MTADTITLKYRKTMFGGFNGILVGDHGTSPAFIAAPTLPALQDTARRFIPAGTELCCVPDTAS